MTPTNPNKWEDDEYGEHLKKVDRMREGEKLPIKPASSIPAEQRKWLYPDWIAEGELTLVAGAPCTGKTALACALSAGVTRGSEFLLHPSLKSTGSGHVIFMSTEDSIPRTLKPRLVAAGADMEKVHFIDNRFKLENETPFSISSPRDAMRLRGWSENMGNNLGLIVIDPIYSAIDGDPNNYFKAREAYEGLAELAKRLSCAILGIAHTVRNPRDKDLLARISGPLAVHQVPRSIILMNKIERAQDESGGTHIFIHAKNNDGKMRDGYEYRILGTEALIDDNKFGALKIEITKEIFGEPLDLLKSSEGSSTKKVSKTDLAKDLLLDILKDGPLSRVEIEETCKDAGVAKGTLLLAKSLLSIVTTKRKGDGRSVWSLPDSLSEPDVDS